MAAFVVDSSVAASWILPDEHSVQTEALSELVISFGALAPALLIYEVRNLLVSAIRTQRIDRDAAIKGIAEIRMLPISYVEPALDQAVIELAATHRLSGYDATFLVLARDQKLPLATFDRKLRSAAGLEAIEVLPKQLV
jgi:predicted nucleic acid-binding protein